jgi:enoyl-CoA hydratase/carnithine racemase
MSRGADSFIDPKFAAFLREDGTIDYSHPQARDGGGLVTLRLFNLLKPVIGAINGPAVGLGVTFILPMDVRIASSEARFGLVFTRRGMVPEGASAFFLPRLVGIARALEWCLAARMVSAEEALAAGLVKSVVAPDELMPAARALAREFAEGSAPVSAALTRQMLWRGLGANHPMDAHRIDSRGIASRSRSDDVAEGVAAWTEKRVPVFRDRVSRDMPDYFPWWDEPDYR